MDIEDEKKLFKIKKIMDNCKDISVFTLLHYAIDLFTKENSVSEYQEKNMLLILTEKQLEIMEKCLEKYNQ